VREPLTGQHPQQLNNRAGNSPNSPSAPVVDTGLGIDLAALTEDVSRGGQPTLTDQGRRGPWPLPARDPAQ